MNTLTVTHPAGQYPIYVRRNALVEAGGLAAEAGLSGRAAIVTNQTVGPLYEDRVAESLSQAGFEPVVCHVPDGESHKTLETAAGLYDQLIEHGLDRNSAIVALGGGVIGDMGGFVAATYLRGVPLVQIPTTLLAMIDSSLGGKVAVDHPKGKNLIGAFYQPRLVITDPDVLATLPEGEWRAGLAEVIKHGIIADRKLFEHLEEQGSEPVDWVVQRAIAVKVDVIQEDPYEKGRRAVLNLGHTFGHAFEAVSGFQLRHGEAVGIGMVAAARAAVAMRICPHEVEARIIRILERFQIPTRLPDSDPVLVRAAMATDKKRKGRKLRFILPEAIGTVVVRDDVPEDIIAETIASLTE